MDAYSHSHLTYSSLQDKASLPVASTSSGCDPSSAPPKPSVEVDKNGLPKKKRKQVSTQSVLRLARRWGRIQATRSDEGRSFSDGDSTDLDVSIFQLV